MKRLFLVLFIFSFPCITFAQTNFASTEAFYIDFSTEVLAYNGEDSAQEFNPFDSLEVVKSQTNEVLNELQTPFDSEKAIMETLLRLEYRIKLIELSIKDIEYRLQSAKPKN